jgi:hypothetical protein
MVLQELLDTRNDPVDPFFKSCLSIWVYDPVLKFRVTLFREYKTVIFILVRACKNVSWIWMIKLGCI